MPKTGKPAASGVSDSTLEALRKIAKENTPEVTSVPKKAETPAEKKPARRRKEGPTKKELAEQERILSTLTNSVHILSNTHVTFLEQVVETVDRNKDKLTAEGKKRASEAATTAEKYASTHEKVTLPDNWGLLHNL